MTIPREYRQTSEVNDMKKYIVLLLLILAGFSSCAVSGTFNISPYRNTNELMWDRQFRNHIKHYFGHLTGYYFWRGTVADQVTDGLWGAPDDIVMPGKNIWMAPSCRPHSCMEKAAYITDGHDELFALIGYMCTPEDRKIDYFNNTGCLSIFYRDRRAEKKLSPYLIRWKEGIVPGAPVYTVRVH